ncbi:MAG: transketolase [Bacilli bacterium]|nr:transketolase [Bacilli bacterium]
MITTIREASEIDENKIIDQIRSIGIDMINEAGSGHPGIVLGAAPIIYSLYAHHMRIDVNDPNYFNRDRFVMSAGHGSALLYATLYMAGFDIALEDLKKFRQLDSITPGHPEYGITPGVDATTGPLGQGVAMAVGMAIAEANLRNRFIVDKKEIIDFNTYALCGDGDLMEGVSYEALSLAGTLNLNKLIVLYDSNNICLDGDTKNTFTENIEERFKSMGWNYLLVEDGTNYRLISEAIEEAKKSTNKPTIIEIKTTIGKYSKLEGTNAVHGKPLDKEDITEIKGKMDIRDIPFTISKTTKDDMRFFINSRCKNIKDKFEKAAEELDNNLKEELNYLISDNKKIELRELIYETPEDSIEAPRDTSHKILNSIVNSCNNIIGGSADLFGACKNYIDDKGNFSSENYLGKNIYFGVREHAMGAILNGIALCGYKTYGSTFLSFSDYMKEPIRLAAMMNLPITYIFTHDSISIGQDGPTHQPIEQLASLRAIPNLEVYRPADANEVIGTYKLIMEKNRGPAVISLSKSNLEILETTKVNEVEKGGYIIYDSGRKPSGIIISTGEEVHLAIEVAKRLHTKGMDVRVVSMPSISKFNEQDDEYKEKILPVEVRKIVIEAASSMSWHNLIFNNKFLITLDEFGCSATKNDIYKKYGFDINSLEEKVENLLK